MRLYFVFIVFIWSFSAKAQSVSGVVTTANGKVLNDVMLYNISSKTHAHSDSNGKFILENTKTEDSLQVTKQGYSTKKIKVSDTETLLVVVEEKPFLLEEVTITNNLKYLNTISKIDLEIQPVSNSQDLMRKVPGFYLSASMRAGEKRSRFFCAVLTAIMEPILM